MSDNKSINASDRLETRITNPVPHSFRRDEPIIVYGVGVYHGSKPNNAPASGLNPAHSLETQVQ